MVFVFFNYMEKLYENTQVPEVPRIGPWFLRFVFVDCKNAPCDVFPEVCENPQGVWKPSNIKFVAFKI